MNDILNSLDTPCYAIDRALLDRNLQMLKSVKEFTGCKILLALKGFAQWSVFPQVAEVLDGAAASSLHEATLARREFGGEVHTYAPVFPEADFPEIMELSEHIVFNSFNQWKKYRDKVGCSGKDIKCGMRVNPRHREVEVEIYDPCAPGSRLGVVAERFEEAELEGISGLHFHTLCELGADALERTIPVVEAKFGKYLERMNWVNFGGGHHITREGYDLDLLCRLIEAFSRKWNVQVYLEPGEAIALNTGFLVASVLDIVWNEMDIAILDTSASAHMPDVLEMPYRPRITGAGEPGERAHTCRLGGMTCLAGDVIGDYSFDKPLQIGDKLIFHDMAIYSMVKNTTFNGVRLPDIVVFDSRTGESEVVRRFGYEDYKGRLS